MATRKKTWVYNPPKQKKTKPQISEESKQNIQKKGNEIVEKVLKPEYLKPVPEDQKLNHIIDIYTKWYRNYFYFCVKYQCPPDSYSKTFESKFARLEYLAEDEFQYSYMRHTEQWFSTYKGTLNECLDHVTNEIPC